jgi:predicted nuclease with TOPRIM domain
MTHDNSLQSVEKLTDRYKELNDQKVRADTKLEEAQKQLEKLQQEAKEQFGTCDVDELKSQLKKLESDNEKMQREYQKHLDDVESELKRVEDDYAKTQA